MATETNNGTRRVKTATVDFLLVPVGDAYRIEVTQGTFAEALMVCSRSWSLRRLLGAKE